MSYIVSDLREKRHPNCMGLLLPRRNSYAWERPTRRPAICESCRTNPSNFERGRRDEVRPGQSASAASEKSLLESTGPPVQLERISAE